MNISKEIVDTGRKPKADVEKLHPGKSCQPHETKITTSFDKISTQSRKGPDSNNHFWIIQIGLIFIDVITVNIGFICSFWIRYGLPIPEQSFLPYKSSFVFLTLIYVSGLAFFRVYKSRFSSSWELFKKVFGGLFLGTLLSIAFVYAFRVKWGAFPTSVFAISFFVNLLLIFKVNQFVLKAKKKIKKQVIILGEGNIDDIVGKKATVERKRIDQIRDLLEYTSVDEIVVSEKITDV